MGIGTCPEGKEDVGKATGVDELIVTGVMPGTPYEDYSSVDIVAKVMEITGGMGVKAVIDGIGASTVDISIECLARRGIFVTFGNASGPVPTLPLDLPASRYLWPSAASLRSKTLSTPTF